jgi:transposase
MNYPPMLKNEKAHDYATRNNLSQQVVLEAVMNNQIPIEGGPLPTPVIPVAATPLTTEPESRQTPEQRREEWRRLYREGNSIAEIAAKTGVSYPTVYQWLVKEGLHAPNSHSPRTNDANTLAVESLDEEEAKLKAQLTAIQHRKQLLAEAKMLHVEPREDGGAIVKKEGNVVVLTRDEVHELANKLTDLLPTPEVEQQV